MSQSNTSRQVASLVLFLCLFTTAIFARITRMDDNNYTTGRLPFDKYTKLREEFVSQHLSRALGADVQLNEDEQQLNAIIMDFKTEELARGFQNPFNFTPSRHFFDVLQTIESSPLFKLIQKMPKGWFFLLVHWFCFKCFYLIHDF